MLKPLETSRQFSPLGTLGCLPMSIHRRMSLGKQTKPVRWETSPFVRPTTERPGAPFVANLVPSKARSPVRSVLAPSSDARSP